MSTCSIALLPPAVGTGIHRQMEHPEHRENRKIRQNFVARNEANSHYQPRKQNIDSL